MSRETPRAKQAWNDYLAMGAGRSLEKLLSQYREQGESKTRVPTLRMATLTSWSVAFGWQARLAEIADAEQRAIIARGIADKEARLAVLDDVHSRMLRLFEARAQDLGGEIAGGDTGLLVRQAKLVKVYETPAESATGDDGELVSAKRDVLVYDYAFDVALAKEVREYGKQAAIERKEWSERHEVTGKDGAPIEVRVEDARQQLAARLAALAARRGEGSADSQPEPAGGGEAPL